MIKLINKIVLGWLLILVMPLHSHAIENKPPVHILMPVYNTEKYILDSVTSVIKQNYPHVKLLIINDGSTDKSVHKIRGLLDSHKDKIEIKNWAKNQGISRARIDLVKWSKKIDPKAYIFWLDSDDKYTDPKFVSEVIDQMQKTNADICLFNFSVAYEDEKQKANASLLLDAKKKTEEILHQISSGKTGSVSPTEIPNLLDITSLGWIKAYAPTINIPEPADGLFEDFVAMAALLNAKTITALPPEKQYIEYLRRGTSACGKRTHNNFAKEMPDQLMRFFETVLKETKNQKDREQKIGMGKSYVHVTLEARRKQLKKIVEQKSFPGVTVETLKKFNDRAYKLEKYMKNKS